MLYENSAQDINYNNNELEQNESKIYQKEINLPEDLSNSQITDQEKENEKKERPIIEQIKTIEKVKNKNVSNKKINNYSNNKKDIKLNKNNSGKKIKKKYVDYISETHSKISEIYLNNNKNDSNIKDIKVKEKNIINDNNNEDNENEEEEEKEEKEENEDNEENEENEENEDNEKDEKNKIISTSDELAYPYKNKFEKKNN